MKQTRCDTWGKVERALKDGERKKGIEDFVQWICHINWNEPPKPNSCDDRTQKYWLPLFNASNTDVISLEINFIYLLLEKQSFKMWRDVSFLAFSGGIDTSQLQAPKHLCLQQQTLQSSKRQKRSFVSLENTSRASVGRCVCCKSSFPKQMLHRHWQH